MDITPTSTAPPPAAAPTGGVKTPEADSETPSRVPPLKSLSFSNGVLKRHTSLTHHHHHLITPPPLPAPPSPAVTYRECLKNHAAAMGGHAVDGCGEFMPSPDSTPSDPTSLKCAACGCHRNFHRRDPEESSSSPLALLPSAPNHHSSAAAQHVIEYQPHHRHHPPPPPPRGGVISSPNSPSPPPISSSYYPSAPHMLLALSASGLTGHAQGNNTTTGAGVGSSSGGRKRFRTKFTADQKEKMFEFAEKVGWKVQRRDDEMISDFCSEVGVERGVLKVWMHNNKNTLGKKVDEDANNTTNNNSNGFGNENPNLQPNNNNNNNNNHHYPNNHHHHHHHHHIVSTSTTANLVVAATNGSSSSS